MPSAASPKASRKEFKKAIDGTGQLHYAGGLSAIPASEGLNRVSARDTRRLLGSANIDADCQRDFPNANRWDFVVGYHRPNGPFAHFIEVHPAASSEVSCMARKLQWVKQYLSSDQDGLLNELPRQFHWVASGKIKIPRHSHQYRQLAKLRKQGLLGPTTKLQLT